MANYGNYSNPLVKNLAEQIKISQCDKSIQTLRPHLEMSARSPLVMSPAIARLPPQAPAAKCISFASQVAPVSSK